MKSLAQSCVGTPRSSCALVAFLLPFRRLDSRQILHAGVAQLVEQLICNQPVGGSIPLASSNPSVSGMLNKPRLVCGLCLAAVLIIETPSALGTGV